MRSKQVIHKICEYCGNDFEAGRLTSRYCSHNCNRMALKESKRKEVIQQTEALTQKKRKEKIQTEIANRPYLSMAEAAILLGVTVKTAYNLAHAGKIHAVRMSSRQTFVTRKSIDELFENRNPYETLSLKERKPIADWYTLDEITDKYGLKRHQIRKIINAENIPEKKEGTRVLIAKNKIDAYFKQRGFDPTILNLSQWYTIEDIKTQYNMTSQGVYVFVSKYQIPKKQQNGKRYYSKQHIDNLKSK